MYGMDDSPVDLLKLTASIKLHEGLRNYPYKDSTGNLTIGYGRNLTNIGISNAEAAYLLGNDITLSIAKAEIQPWWNNVKDNDARARAFIEIGFNLGFGKLATFRTALDAAMRSDWPACATAFLDSLWHSQVGKRAEVLAAMILTGEDPKPPYPDASHTSV